MKRPREWSGVRDELVGNCAPREATVATVAPVAPVHCYLTNGVPSEIRGLLLWHLADGLVTITMGKGFCMPHQNRLQWLQSMCTTDPLDSGFSTSMRVYDLFFKVLHKNEVYEFDPRSRFRHAEPVCTPIQRMEESMSGSLQAIYNLAQTCRVFHDVIHANMESLWSFYGRARLLFAKVIGPTHAIQGFGYFRLGTKVADMSYNIALALRGNSRISDHFYNIALRYIWHFQWLRIQKNKILMTFKQRQLSQSITQQHLKVAYENIFGQRTPWLQTNRLPFAPPPGPEPIHVRFVEVNVMTNTVSHVFTGLRKLPDGKTYAFTSEQRSHAVMEVMFVNHRAIDPVKVTIKDVQQEWNHQTDGYREFMQLHRKLAILQRFY